LKLLARADAQRIPLADGSVHCCVTSPPYWWLRDYGAPGQLGLERTPEEYVARMVAVFREVRRVLRDDGTLWLNLGDCYATGAGKVGECPGGGKQGDNWKGATTSPNRMPLFGLKPKDLVGIPWRVAFALQADGWYLRSDIIWAKPNPMPESVTDRPTKAHEYLFLLTKSKTYYYDAEAIKEAGSGRCPGNKQYKYDGLKGHETKHGILAQSNVPQVSRDKRTVWTVATQPYSGAHFATFPPKLIEPCILAGCPVGGVVLDPFVGSGTTVAVAVAHRRSAVGLDISTDYFTLSKQRTDHVQRRFA